MRAVEISPDAFIAAYNLGLVRARFGRLADAMPLYEQALARDPEVDDEALADIENALIDLPQEPALHYALGRLYEAEGRRSEAAEAYATYLQLGGFGAPYDAAAERRVAVLTAPPAPLEIAGDLLDVTLGGALAPAPLHPGDPLHVEFELVTPGEALPGRVEVTTRLLDGAGSELARSEVPIEVPADAIGYVLEEPFLELPMDLEAGAYVLEVQVASFEGPTVSAEVAIDVAGEPTPLRQLVGRNVRLLSLTGGRALYDADDVANPGRIVNAMIGELRVAVEAAEENLPVIEAGRFAGMSGGAVFETSGAEEVLAFLAYVAADGVRDLEIAFVDAYAQWVIEGAPDGD